jgi:urease accessory protein
LIRALRVRAGADWTGDAADTVVLDFDERHRRRITMKGVRGLDFLLDLPDAVMLRGGDALVLEDGRLVEVVAAPEPLVELRGKAPGDLARLAWHIGNRHLPAQILAAAIRIRRDHVIEEMLRGLGARLLEIEAPFDPEGGAYAVAAEEPRDHDHKHDHGHGHKHDHHDHKHGHHNHDHGHKHGHDDHEHHGKHDHGKHHGHAHD